MNSTNCTCNATDCASCPVEYLATSTIIILDIIYVLIVIIGLIGNIMTCAATITQKSMRRSIHMYVFNLAICDMLILIFYVPNEMMRMGNQARYVWGIEMCVLTYTVLPVAINCTVFTLLAISLDRTRGVVRPFEWRNGPNDHAKIIIPIIWISAISIAVPVAIHAELVDFNGGLVCTEIWSISNSLIYWHAMFAITFAIPLVIIFVLHVLMIYMLAKEQVLVEQKANKKMIKMTISIVIIFAICTGSQHFYFFMITYSKMSESTDALLFFGSNLLVALQSACNPILYGTFRQDFNLAFKEFYSKVKTFILKYNVWTCTKLRDPFSKVNMVTTALVLRKSIPNDNNESFHIKPKDSCKTPLLNGTINFKTQYISENPLQNKNNDHIDSISSIHSNKLPPSKVGTHTNKFDDENTGQIERKDSKVNFRKNDRKISAESRRVDMIRNFSQDSTRSYSPYDNFDSDDNFEYENPRQNSAITLHLKEISYLLNELQRSEILDDYKKKSRLSCEFLRLTDDEKNVLFASYPCVDWLDLLTMQDSKETYL